MQGPAGPVREIATHAFDENFSADVEVELQADVRRGTSRRERNDAAIASHLGDGVAGEQRDVECLVPGGDIGRRLLAGHERHAHVLQSERRAHALEQ